MFANLLQHVCKFRIKFFDKHFDFTFSFYSFQLTTDFICFSVPFLLLLVFFQCNLITFHPAGIEPTTCRLWVPCFNHASPAPDFIKMFKKHFFSILHDKNSSLCCLREVSLKNMATLLFLSLKLWAVSSRRKIDVSIWFHLLWREQPPSKWFD